MSINATKKGIKAKKSTKAQTTIRQNKNKDEKQAQLVHWAHEGTKESVDKIVDFMNKEEDDDLLGFAECAYDEGSYFYYSPNTDAEEEDFLLAKMIRAREDNLDDLEYKIEAGELEVKKLKLDQKVYKGISKANEDLKVSVYGFSEDYLGMIAGRLEEIEENAEYERLWIDTARKMIKVKKYQSIPADVIDHIHFDEEDPNFCFEKKD